MPCIHLASCSMLTHKPQEQPARHLSYLDGKEVTSSTLPTQVHPPKSSTTDWLQDLKVINGHVVDVVAAGADSRGG